MTESPIMQQKNINDRDLLRQVQAAFGNPPALSGWRNKRDMPCAAPAWPGVLCDWETGSVAELRLDGLGLAGTLPLQLFMLSSLRMLDLSGNQLIGSIPDSPVISQSSWTLEYLDLSSNMLTGSLPTNFSFLSALKQLDLSHNQFSVSPDRFSKVLLKVSCSQCVDEQRVH